MNDREKIIQGLQELADHLFHEYKVCYHGDEEDCYNRFLQANNALDLLKEQEERKGWVSVIDDMPIELHSIFWPFFGTDKWNKAMWREQSDKVLVAVEFADGTRRVTTGETHDGEWRTSISPTLPHLVTHWMKMPDLPPILIT